MVEIARTWRLDQDRVREWSVWTGDSNPLHIDPDFAAGTPFGRPIVQGHLLAALVVDVLGASGFDRGRVSVSFTVPVPVGAEVTVDAVDGIAADLTAAGERPVRIDVDVPGPECSTEPHRA